MSGLIARHRVNELRHLLVEYEAILVAEALHLVARRAIVPTSHIDLIAGAENIDQKIIPALLEPQVLVGGAKEVNAAVGRRAATIMDRIAAKTLIEIIVFVSTSYRIDDIAGIAGLTAKPEIVAAASCNRIADSINTHSIVRDTIDRIVIAPMCRRGCSFEASPYTQDLKVNIRRHPRRCRRL